MGKHVIFSYDLKGLSSTDKVKLVYLLKGRNGQKGIVEQKKGWFLANSCFVLPEGEAEGVAASLRQRGIHYKRLRVMLID